MSRKQAEKDNKRQRSRFISVFCCFVEFMKLFGMSRMRVKNFVKTSTHSWFLLYVVWWVMKLKKTMKCMWLNFTEKDVCLHDVLHTTHSTYNILPPTWGRNSSTYVWCVFCVIFFVGIIILLAVVVKWCIMRHPEWDEDYLIYVHVHVWCF